MTKKNVIEEKESIAPVLKEMKLWETKTWPLHRFTSVRASYQVVGTQMCYKYTSKINRENNVIEVTRIK